MALQSDNPPLGVLTQYNQLFGAIKALAASLRCETVSGRKTLGFYGGSAASSGVGLPGWLHMKRRSTVNAAALVLIVPGRLRHI